ncbi:signal peptidase I [Patescibacteria group bacterium]|nr:signal peptidase I [Patescibacteria group bacterium]MBU1931736.1 signal peptidase I [Patescibacteria group bacterium]
MRLIKALLGFLLDFVEVFVIALALFVVIYIFLFQPHEVKGKSMYANFDDGDYLLTDKISYRFRDIQRGDVIVFKAPRNEEYDYIKRVVALPHERVKIQAGRVFINSVLLDETDYLPSSVNTRSGQVWQEDKELTIPSGEFFVLGDNRDHSSDSRDWGTVPADNIVGRAWCRYWPTSAIGLIPVVDYPTVGKTGPIISGINSLTAWRSNPFINPL